MKKTGLVCFAVLLGLALANKPVFASSCHGGGGDSGHQGHGAESKDTEKKAELETSITTVYVCPMHPAESVSHEPGKCPVCGMVLEAKQVECTSIKKNTSYEQNTDETPAQSKHVYACPMHPEVQSDKPGRCPKCGMELVEEQAESASNSNVKSGEKDKADAMQCQDMSNCDMSSNGEQSVNNKEKIAVKTDKNSNSAIYQCPMHSDVTSNKPGKCPKCGMNLEKK